LLFYSERILPNTNTIEKTIRVGAKLSYPKNVMLASLVRIVKVIVLCDVREKKKYIPKHGRTKWSVLRMLVLETQV
jgi:hypothetical protein